MSIFGQDGGCELSYTWALERCKIHRAGYSPPSQSQGSANYLRYLPRDSWELLSWRLGSTRFFIGSSLAVQGWCNYEHKGSI